MPKNGAVNETSEEPKSEAQPGQEPAGADDEQRRALIAAAAYYRAEQRGFVPGCELEDWLAAEAEVDARCKPG